jgi:hypothetical protein
MRKFWILLFCLLLVVPAGAQAQEKGFVLAEVGLTFAESTNGLFGAQVGVSVTPNLQVVGTVEYMADVLTGELTEYLRLIGRVGDANISGKLPATYAGVGLRYHFMTQGSIQPFVQFEGGMGKTDPQLTIIKNGQDITEQVPEATGLEKTNGAIALSGGIRANFGERLTSQFAFKWLNIFTEETLKVNRFDFAIGVRF